jgi:UDP-N-acetylmuramoylalanine--D-glutamate ligase
VAVHGKKRAVIGMGKTGLSCARFLRSQGDAFSWFDTRVAPPDLDAIVKEFPDVVIHCGPLQAGMLSSFDEIIVSPGVSVGEQAIRSAAEVGVQVVGDIELFVRATGKPIIAITGSNAKSTVTTLVGEMAEACGLRAGVGGNLGTPVLDMLRDDSDTDCYVLELSSFQLETTFGLHAMVAVVLNISDDHMDRYDSLEEYIKAKHRIYSNAKNVVFNRADSCTQPAAEIKGLRWSFGLDEPGANAVGVMELDGDSWLDFDKQHPLLRVSDIRIAGQHNLANVAAALVVAIAAHWDMDSCARVVKSFNGLPHRCQWVAEKNGVRFYNDSKGTNIGATVAAIQGLHKEKNIVLIAGGDGKGADFSQLREAVVSNVKQLVLIGRDAEKIAVACAGVKQVHALSMIDAVQKSWQLAESGDIVLLSPACASFDMFNGYDDRGRQFCAAVEALS